MPHATAARGPGPHGSVRHACQGGCVSWCRVHYPHAYCVAVVEEASPQGIGFGTFLRVVAASLRPPLPWTSHFTLPAYAHLVCGILRWRQLGNRMPIGAGGPPIHRNSCQTPWIVMLVLCTSFCTPPLSHAGQAAVGCYQLDVLRRHGRMRQEAAAGAQGGRTEGQGGSGQGGRGRWGMGIGRAGEAGGAGKGCRACPWWPGAYGVHRCRWR